MDVQEAALRLLVAAVLGSLIGIDRERLDRAAGLRTHALVATASALIMIVSAHGFNSTVEPGRVVLDPSRMAAQVVSGIGFLGAGVIILRQNIVRGLTTAASIWAVAGVGLAAGSGLYSAAIVATGILLVILVGLKPVEQRLFNSKRTVQVAIRATWRPGLLSEVEAAAASVGLDLQRMSVDPWGDGESVVGVHISNSDRRALVGFADRVRGLADVHRVAYSPLGQRPDELAEAEED